MAARMTFGKASPLSIASAAIAGVALWLSSGVLGIARDGPTLVRIGFLPPWWRLALFVFAALAIVLVVRPRWSRVQPLAFAVVLLLPWLPLPVPRVLMMWSGPVVWLVWIAIALGWMAARDRAIVPAAIKAWLARPDRAPAVAMACAAVVYASAAVRVSPILPGGDEPHYLIITQSLLNDGDLQIENNHRLGDYRSYFLGTLPPDYLRRGENGQIYSIHAPGLPALIAPVFWLLGYPGVKALLVFIAAWGAGLVWRSAYAVTKDAAAAWFGWAAVCLTTPFVFHAFTVYPDGVGAVLTMCVVASLAEGTSDRSRWWWGRRGIVLTMLPWLHTRFTLVAAVLGMVLLARRWRDAHDRKAGLIAFLVPIVVGATGWFSYFYFIYGTPNPAAPYGGYTQTAIANLAAGMPGLLFDQQFGLLANAPVYGMAFIGLWALARAEWRLCLLLLFLVVPYWVVTSEYRMWWGGSSAPARFLVAVLLPFGIPAAMFWKSARTGASRTIGLAALTFSLLLSAVLVIPEGGRLAYNQRDGHALWLRWASAASDIDMGAPSFFRDTPMTALLQAAIWIASLVAAWMVLVVIERRAHVSRGAFALATLCTLALSSTVALSGTKAIGAGSPVPVSTTQMEFLQSFDPDAWPLGVTYDPPRIVRAREIPSFMEIAAMPLGRSESAAGLQAMWAPVPAGSYRMRLHAPASGTGRDITLSVGRTEAPVRSWRLEGGALDVPLLVPVLLRSITLRADAGSRDVLARPTLHPQQLTPPGQRLTAEYATAAHRYGAVIVYGLGNDVYFEKPGLWVAGAREAAVMFAPDTRQRLQRVLVRNGPVANHVTLASGNWREEFPLAANQQATLDVPLGPAEATVVRVRVASGFRPSEVDPKSEDRRFLGCWIELR